MGGYRCIFGKRGKKIWRTKSESLRPLRFAKSVFNIDAPNHFLIQCDIGLPHTDDASRPLLSNPGLAPGNNPQNGKAIKLTAVFRRDENNTVSVRESFKSILRILEKAKIEKALLDYIRGYKWDAPYLIAEQADFEERLQRKFRIASTFISKRLCHSRCAPIYLAVKR